MGMHFHLQMKSKQLCNVNQQKIRNTWNVWKTHHTKLHVQMVCLMMNTRCSKHVEDAKNIIKTLIWKSVHFVGLRCVIVKQWTVQKKRIISRKHLLILLSYYFLHNPRPDSGIRFIARYALSVTLYVPCIMLRCVDKPTSKRGSTLTRLHEHNNALYSLWDDAPDDGLVTVRKMYSQIMDNKGHS